MPSNYLKLSRNAGVKLPFNEYEKLVEFMPRRILAAIWAKDGFTKY